tara:strand:- start:8118 stop:8747 length:630 start_codon:yes stop_codon:yes gene_type:complete
MDIRLDLFLDNLSSSSQSIWGIILFISLYAIWVSFLLPGVWASMLAGFLYGNILGSILVFVGASLGAHIVFFLGRRLLKNWVEDNLSYFPKLREIKKSISSEGLKLIFLTRLSPAFPFSLLNLAYGISDVKLKDFTIGLLGIIPGTILFCSLGSIAVNLTEFDKILKGEQDPSVRYLELIGLIATVCVVWFISKAAKRALKESEINHNE